MKRTMILLLTILMLCSSALAGSGEEKIIPGKVKDGHALLTDMTQFFSEIARKGTGLESAERRLNAAIADGAATFKDGKVDAIFYHRFQRLLLIFKLIMTPVTPTNNVWEPVIKKELGEFIRDVLGEEWILNFKDKSNIGRLAAAMEEEFANLWIYLETLERRSELKKKYGNRMLPPPPPPPSKIPPPPPKMEKKTTPPPPAPQAK